MEFWSPLHIVFELNGNLHKLVACKIKIRERYFENRSRNESWVIADYQVLGAIHNEASAVFLYQYKNNVEA